MTMDMSTIRTLADEAEYQAALKAVRGAELALKRPLGVLADLQGPKLRLGQGSCPKQGRRSHS